MSHIIILYIVVGALAGFTLSQLYRHHALHRLQHGINTDVLLCLTILNEWAEGQNGGLPINRTRPR